MSETTVILVSEISEKSGESNGRAWTKYAIKDGNGDFYSTFDSGVIAPAKELTGKKAEISFEQKDQFRNLLTVKPVEESPISQRAPDGSADWDVIGLRKTRCALWAAYIPHALSAGLSVWNAERAKQPGVGETTEAELLHFLNRFGRNLILGAEVYIYHRDPPKPDEDIPF